MENAYQKILSSCQAHKGRYSCVIFLDIDGVLNDFDDRSGKGAPICEEMVARLKEIVMMSGGVIILTSSWRMYYHDQQESTDFHENERFKMLLRMFDQYGLTMAGATEEIGFDRASRPLEIRHWLMDKPDVERFVILDDLDWHWGWLADHVVCTRRRDASSLSGWRSGLDGDNVKEALKILGVLPAP